MVKPLLRLLKLRQSAGDATPSPDGERKRHGSPRHRRDRDREGRQDGDQSRPPQSADRKERQDFKRPGR